MTRLELADLFATANGQRDQLPRVALCGLLGLDIPCRIWYRMGWMRLCDLVHRRVTGQPLPVTKLETWAERNAYWGQVVASALRKEQPCKNRF